MTIPKKEAVKAGSTVKFIDGKNISISQNVWGSDNICIKEKKKFGGKNLA